MKAIPQDAALVRLGVAELPDKIVLAETELRDGNFPSNRSARFMQRPPAIKPATQYALLAKAVGDAPINSASVLSSRETLKSYPPHKVVIAVRPSAAC
jgi:hypothetical protein